MKLFPSPLGVISFFTWKQQSKFCLKMVSVPSRGYLFFYQPKVVVRRWFGGLFPSPLGVISFFTVWLTYDVSKCKFPSPLGVISFFTRYDDRNKRRTGYCFRPLSGLSLFLRRKKSYDQISIICFRPLSGLSLFLQCLRQQTKRAQRFRPLSGLSFFTL